jgi:hypothetical protein
MRGDKERGMMKSKLKGGSEASLVRLAVRVEGGNRGNTVGSRMRMRDRIPIEDFSSPTPKTKEKNPARNWKWKDPRLFIGTN